MRGLVFAISVVVALLVGAGAGAGAGASGAGALDGVEVTVEPTSAQVLLGESTTITVAVTNHGGQASDDLVVHIDITDPTSGSSVDPEDWTATLSKRVGVVAPGSTATVGWDIQPVSGGSFVLYAVVLAPGAETVSASNVLEVIVTDQRSLNPGGILPAAIGATAVVGALLIVQLRRARRVPESLSSNGTAADLPRA